MERPILYAVPNRTQSKNRHFDTRGFTLSSVNVTTIGEDVRLFALDMPGKSANVLTDQVYHDLDEALQQVEAEEEPPRGIILVTAKPSIFIAGADLNKISDNLDWPDEKIFEFCDHGRGIMSRFSQLPETVSVAAIHGISVGGGLELPLWCDHRIATDNRRTLLGLPEVKLGLIPGWAGTVRLPRLIGLEPAVDLTVSGDLITAKEALELGIVSLVVPEDSLIQTALQIIEREHYTQGFLKKRELMAAHVKKRPKSIRQFRQATTETIEANVEVDPSAPLIVMEHMIATAKSPAAEACQGESEAFAKVWGSLENRGLLHYFFLDERAKKTRGRFSGEPPEIRTVGIVGAGLMGTQIAKLAAAAGFNLKIHDADQRQIDTAVDTITNDPRNKAESIQVASAISDLAGCELVIECVVEKLKIKQDLFRRICDVVDERAFLATNTSTIPVSEIASAVKNPARLFGLHFCIPTEPLKLVEVIPSETTSDLTLNIGIELVRWMRKTPIVVQDHPGFIVNRLLCPVFGQATVLLQEGVEMQRMDRIFREFGFAAGPLEMIDFIGVDTIMYAGETFLRTMPDLVQVTPILPALVKRNRNGRKAGLGFYQYDSFDGPAVFDESVVEILSKYRVEADELSDEQILLRLLEPMANEAAKALQEGVVEDAQDIDLCSVLGTTFPRVRGGILKWFNELR